VDLSGVDLGRLSVIRPEHLHGRDESEGTITSDTSGTPALPGPTEAANAGHSIYPISRFRL
jgi:hypothetical protein